MKRLRPDIVVGLGMLLILFMLLGALFWIWPTDAPPAAPKYIPSAADLAIQDFYYEPFRVTRVIDGDTIVLNASLRIRLRKYNAPELDEEGGPEAKARLEELCLDKPVEIEVFAESYNRLVAEVFLADGREISEAMKASAFPIMAVTVEEETVLWDASTFHLDGLLWREVIDVPPGTLLELTGMIRVEGIPLRWYETEYKGKKGHISEAAIARPKWAGKPKRREE